MKIRTVAKLLYGLFGLVFLLAGTSVMLLRTPLLPEAIRDIINEQGRGEPHTLHLIQEFGSLMIFAGIMSIWYVRHYEQSRAFHLAMTTFWALYSLAHWFYVGGPIQSMKGPMINTIPFALFAVVGLIRLSTEKRVDAG